MTLVNLEIATIPHGHGLSFKKCIADGLLECRTHEEAPHETHAASYQRGLQVGEVLRNEIAKRVKK